METKAVARYMRISPRKARLVTDMIKGKDLAEAEQILDYCPKDAALVVAKVLASATANAEHNNDLDPDALYVARAFVDEGPTLKRFRPRALGRATRINKRTSHITIVLDEREPGAGARRRGLLRRRRAAAAAAEAEAAEEALEEEETEEEEIEEGELDALELEEDELDEEEGEEAEEPADESEGGKDATKGSDPFVASEKSEE